MKKTRITFFSLFSGAGGLDLGFKKAGFISLGSSDIEPESEKTFKLNFPKEPFIRKDIRELSVREILKKTNGIKPDVIIGGPPCQGFSVMGDKNSFDPRNTLFESYVRIVDGLRPKCFVFENVKGVKNMFGGRYLVEIANSFAAIGYDVYFDVLNAADYGVPQRRERVIIFGTRLKNKFDYPKKEKRGIRGLKSFSNTGEAILDLVGKSRDVPNHASLDHNDTVIARYKLIPEGGKLPPIESLPDNIRRKNFGSTYVRLDRKAISPTLVPGNNAFPIHPTLDRSLTPREAARIQTFPDSFLFSGTRRRQCILVGDAVPPLLAAHIAVSVKKYLTTVKDSAKGDKLLVKRFEKISLSPFNKKTSNEARSAGNQINFIDLFSGAGGITVGFMNAGLKPILCSDFDEYVAQTHKESLKQVPFVFGDLSDRKVRKQVLSAISGKEVDIVVGGPPCQGFSIFGDRRFINTQKRDYNPHKDPRNRLVYTFFDYVKAIRPKWFMMENVPGFVSLDKGCFLKRLLRDYAKIGYKNCEYKIINTANYGVPQRRKRFILIGNRTGNFIPWPKEKYFANPEDWQKPFRTIAEVISDLASPGSAKKVSCHLPMNHSALVKERFSYIKEGEKLNINNLPNHLKLGKNTKKEIKNYSHIYERLDRNKPSVTIVPGHSAFPIHPWLDRQLTVREAARIQTFPDNIEFKGPISEQCKQVGNAFPILAAECFANLFKKAMVNDWKKGNLSKLAKYSIISLEEKGLQIN